jgi:signal transduction histidine kinase
MTYGDKCLGFVGFDWVRQKHACSRIERSLLQLLASLMVNVSRRVRKQQKIDGLLVQLKYQNERFREYSYLISHNLRSSIAQIRALYELMQIEPEEDQYPVLMGRSIQTLHKTVEKVDQLIHFEERQTNIKLQPYDIVISLNEVLAQLNEEVKKKRVKIQRHHPEIVSFRTVPAYMDSIFYNLISNAIKYGITEQSKTVQIKLEDTGDDIIITVADQGLGIGIEENLDQIFELGSRFHNGPSNDGEGLGLYILKKQVEQLKGCIKVKSRLNEGTAFKIVIPKPGLASTLDQALPDRECCSNL